MGRSWAGEVSRGRLGLCGGGAGVEGGQRMFGSRQGRWPECGRCGNGLQPLGRAECPQEGRSSAVMAGF